MKPRAAAAKKLIWLLSLALSCWGCGREQWSGSIDTRDGVAYVSNPAVGLWQTRARAPLEFELERTFGVEREPADAILAPIDAVEVDDRGNVYVLSSAPGRLVAFDAGGNVLWSSDQRGQGPGDLSKPYGLARDGRTTLYLTNQSGARLDAWSTAGTFLQSRSMMDDFHYLLRTVGFLADGRLVLEGSGGEGADASVVVYDLEGTASPATEFSVDVTDQRGEEGGVLATVALADGMIVVGDYDSYDIRWFNTDGSLERVWSRDFHHLTGVAIDEDRRASTVFSWLDPPLRLGSGQWLIFLSWIETDDVDATFVRLLETGERPVHKTSLDLFDADGRLLFSREQDGIVSDIGRPVKVDAAGRLYTLVDDPYPHVRRYAVHVR